MLLPHCDEEGALAVVERLLEVVPLGQTASAGDRGLGRHRERATSCSRAPTPRSTRPSTPAAPARSSPR